MSITTDHSRATKDGAHAHGKDSIAPDGSRADRLHAFDAASFDVPKGREEAWRFSPVRDLKPLFADALTGVAPSFTAEVPAGATLTEIAAADRVAIAGAPGDRTSAASWESAAFATRITLEKNAVLDEAVTVSIEGDSKDAAAQHIQIVAEPFSQGTVVLDHTGTAVLSQTVEVHAKDGAHLTVVSVQDWNNDTIHAAAHRVLVGRDATVKHVVVTLGGGVVRITPDSAFEGPGGDVDMYGLYLAGSGQHQEHRLFVDHAVPNCKSRVTYKGALAGATARTVWIGDVLIRAAAEGTDTYEYNRNLVLTDGARADSVPNLEIETGEIEGAGHASATGRFDDEQLFYLQARGISADEARRLVVRGFFNDLLKEIGVSEIQERLMDTIDARLDADA